MSATPGGAAGPWGSVLEIAAAIVSNMSWQETVNVIAEKIGVTMFAWSTGITSYDEEHHTVTWEASWCEGGLTEEDLAYIGHVLHLEERPDWKPIVEGREVVEWHIDDPGLSEADREVMNTWGLKSSIDAPLIYNDKVIGTAQVAETRFVRHFTSAERDLFLRLCQLASIGVYNAQQTRGRIEMERRFAALADLGERLGGAESADDVGAVVTTVVTSGLAATRVELGPATPQIREAVVRRLGDAGLDQAAGPLPGEGAAVRLLVPVVVRGTPQALLVATWEDQQHRVSEAEVEFARIVAGQAALALGQTGFGGDATAR